VASKVERLSKLAEGEREKRRKYLFFGEPEELWIGEAGENHSDILWESQKVEEEIRAAGGLLVYKRDGGGQGVLVDVSGSVSLGIPSDSQNAFLVVNHLTSLPDSKNWEIEVLPT